jgi:hypothetical protein
MQTCKDPAAYDALDTTQWDFSSLPSAREFGHQSVGIGWVGFLEGCRQAFRGAAAARAGPERQPIRRVRSSSPKLPAVPKSRFGVGP